MKKFDCVKMMRDIRDPMAERYLKNPELELKELAEIRKKYGIIGAKKKIQPTSRGKRSGDDQPFKNHLKGSARTSR
jgi:hypothetical protein